MQNWKHTCWQTSFFLCFLLYFCVIELFCSYCYALHTIKFDFMLTTYCFSEFPHTSFQAFSKSPSNDFLFVFHMNIFCSKELVFVPSSFKMIKKSPISTMFLHLVETVSFPKPLKEIQRVKKRGWIVLRHFYGHVCEKVTFGKCLTFPTSGTFCINLRYTSP